MPTTQRWAGRTRRFSSRTYRKVAAVNWHVIKSGWASGKKLTLVYNSVLGPSGKTATVSSFDLLAEKLVGWRVNLVLFLVSSSCCVLVVWVTL